MCHDEPRPDAKKAALNAGENKRSRGNIYINIYFISQSKKKEERDFASFLFYRRGKGEGLCMLITRISVLLCY